jgi:protein phosphatase 2C
MEDRHCAVQSDDHTSLALGVFDGHNGHQVAAAASKALPRIVLDRWFKDERLTTQQRVVFFRDAFLDVDSMFMTPTTTPTKKDDLFHIGSTACLAVIDRSATSPVHNLWVANTGDSRCVLRTTTDIVQMSVDHKPGTDLEKQRIEQKGGYVTTVDGIPRVMGNLSLSRALGDQYMRPYVIPNPGVSFRELHGTERYLLLATDGLWDVYDSKEACDFLDKQLLLLQATTAPASSTKNKDLRDLRGAAVRKLVMAARRRRSSDNITVLAYFFDIGQEQ